MAADYKGFLETKKGTPHTVFHTFRVSKSSPKTVHVFAESTDDIAFYAPYIRSRGYNYKPYDCDNKDNVLKLASFVKERT